MGHRLNDIPSQYGNGSVVRSGTHNQTLRFDSPNRQA